MQVNHNSKSGADKVSSVSKKPRKPFDFSTKGGYFKSVFFPRSTTTRCNCNSSRRRTNCNSCNCWRPRAPRSRPRIDCSCRRRHRLTTRANNSTTRTTNSTSRWCEWSSAGTQPTKRNDGARRASTTRSLISATAYRTCRPTRSCPKSKRSGWPLRTSAT